MRGKQKLSTGYINRFLLYHHLIKRNSSKLRLFKKLLWYEDGVNQRIWDKKISFPRFVAVSFAVSPQMYRNGNVLFRAVRTHFEPRGLLLSAVLSVNEVRSVPVLNNWPTIPAPRFKNYISLCNANTSLLEVGNEGHNVYKSGSIEADKTKN
jgi:hypothetical protein